MDNFLKWAFAQELGTGEKLVLVYLASQVGTAGVGRMDREALAAATDYEPRSLQRILKNLRDAKLLHDHGPWFALGSPAPDEAGDAPPGDMQPLGANMRTPVAPALSSEEIEAAGEVIARHLTEAGTGVLNRFNDVSLRLLQGIERIAQAARVWEDQRVEPPPPDPVRESTHFKVFMASGFMDEAEAYDLAKKRLEAEGASPTPALDQVARMQGGRLKTADVEAAAHARREYLDSPLGRFERVRDILDPTGAEPWADAMAVWTRLELAENKHTVEGETTAFELLYPAIVVAARRCADSHTLTEFLNEKAIKENRAPWDVGPVAVNNDVEIQRELAHMLDELERVNHPMCQATPRTVEGALTEPLAAYHLRVKRVHQQLKKLQEMGV